MEKRRTRIALTIVAMVLALAVMSVGVYAASTINFSTTGGAITFTADDVFATVALTEGGTYNKSFDENTTDTSETITLDAITFTDENQSANVVLTVTNDFDNGQAITVTFDGSVTGTDSALISCAVSGNDGETVESAALSSGYELAAGKTLTITVALGLTSAQSGVTDAAIGFTMSLARAAA